MCFVKVVNNNNFIIVKLKTLKVIIRETGKKPREKSRRNS